MITTPVRHYLIFLFVAVVGIGAYLVFKQQNDDYDASQALSGVSVKVTPVATATPTATASPVSTINTTQETSDLDTLLSSISDSDFDDSTLTPSSLGL